MKYVSVNLFTRTCCPFEVVAFTLLHSVLVSIFFYLHVDITGNVILAVPDAELIVKDLIVMKT